MYVLVLTMAMIPAVHSPWSGYMFGVYRSRQGPQPLGTVSCEEIEAKAREKLQDSPGT